MSKFQKGYSETESCVFLRAEDRSKAQVILSNNYQLFWQFMQNISHPKIPGYFCVEEGLKYQYPGGIFVLDSVL